MPSDPIAVVRREGVVIVVITLSHRDQGGEQAVPRRIGLRVWLSSDGVRDRVDGEGCMRDQHQAKEAGQNQEPPWMGVVA